MLHLALPYRCMVALRLHRLRQKAAGQRSETGIVFPSAKGTQQDSHNIRRDFRRVVADAGLPAQDWTPREMRHSFVSVLSDSSVRVEDIARLVRHSGTRVTELVYRKQIRPVLEDGAIAMDSIFPTRNRKA